MLLTIKPRIKSRILNLFLYLVFPVSCIMAYAISKRSTEQKLVRQAIIYTPDSASEVYFVWGLLQGPLPGKAFWPAGSYVKNDLIWSPTTRDKDRFLVTVSLPPGTQYYYWMVHTRDVRGAPTEIWDTGGQDKTYFTGSVPISLLRPGYFIFLAGALPLLIGYARGRKKAILKEDAKGLRLSGYIPQLDTIRAFAVILVIIHHWIPERSWIHAFPNGQLGVNTFFALSGFLITAILLKARNELQQDGNTSRISAFKNFYVRRTLRIFPIYYLLLAVFLFLKEPDLLRHPAAYFTYTSNILFFSKEFFPAHLAHLWSLAVEEQFYLLWPWLILLSGKRALPYIISLFIVIGISTNYIFVEKGWWIEVLTPACFDAFAIGGFLSYLMVYRTDVIENFRQFYGPAFLLLLCLLALQIVNYSILPRRTTHALLAVMAIYYSLFMNNCKVANWVLTNKWLIAIGKLSYGIYLYHLFIPDLARAIHQKCLSHHIDLLWYSRVSALLQPAYAFILQLVLLLLICRISWIIIEKPVNRLKRYFEYAPTGVLN